MVIQGPVWLLEGFNSLGGLIRQNQHEQCDGKESAISGIQW